MSLIKIQVNTANQKYPIYIGNNICGASLIGLIRYKEAKECFFKIYKLASYEFKIGDKKRRIINESN